MSHSFAEAINSIEREVGKFGEVTLQIHIGLFERFSSNISGIFISRVNPLRTSVEISARWNAHILKANHIFILSYEISYFGGRRF